MNQPDADSATRVERLLTALVALSVAEREERAALDDSTRRAEPILAAAGLSIAEIASLTGKKYETVKTILRRSRSSAGGK